MRLRPLFLILPVAALVIAALVAYRVTRPPPADVPIADPQAVRPAPLFELRDEQGRPVRLKSAVGRSKILVVFFRVKDSLDDSPVLNRVRERIEGLRAAAPMILAVGSEQSARYRQMISRDGPPGLPILSDFPPVQVRAWGVLDPKTEQVREAVFVLDGTGLIRHSHVEPDLGTPDDWIRELRAVR